MLAHLISALIGPKRVIHTTLKSLNSDNFETFNLAGKPLIMISDSEDYEGDLSVLKQIVGGDIIKGRAKYVQGSFDIANTGNVMVVANIPFTSKETSNAINRRLLIFPALHKSSSRVPLLLRIGNLYEGPLVKELGGILN